MRLASVLSYSLYRVIFMMSSSYYSDIDIIETTMLVVVTNKCVDPDFETQTFQCYRAPLGYVDRDRVTRSFPYKSYGDLAISFNGRSVFEIRP